MEPETRRRRAAALVFIALLAGATVLRLYYTTRPCAITADIFRNLIHGALVDRIGFSAARRPIGSFHSLQWVCWPNVPYIYPVISLLFFSAVAGIWPTVFFAKLVLTAIEAANAGLVYRLTRNGWLALIYWSSPVSVWWVSREAQFEPVQNLFVLGALCLLPRFAPLAILLLALGIQSKLSAAVLLPFFLFRVYQTDRRRFNLCLLVLAVGFLPTLLAQLSYHSLENIARNASNLGFNPYFWNPFNIALRGWMPLWLALVNLAVTVPVLLLLAWRFVHFAAALGISRPPAFFDPDQEPQ